MRFLVRFACCLLSDVGTTSPLSLLGFGLRLGSVPGFGGHGILGMEKQGNAPPRGSCVLQENCVETQCL